MAIKSIKILRHGISHGDASRSRAIEMRGCITDCITDDNIEMGLLFACVGAILSAPVRAHIFDMYTREHSINPARKRDTQTCRCVFAFSRKSPVRNAYGISDRKYPGDFSPPEPRDYCTHYRRENRIFPIAPLHRVCLMHT